MTVKKLISSLLVLTTITGLLAGCYQAPANTESIAPESTAPSVEETLPAATIAAGNVVINEVMPDNEKLSLGHELDWIELCNLDEVPIDLTGYYLTDDPDQPHIMSLEGRLIPAEGYLVITLDDSSPFRLSSSGESVYLVCEDSIISQLTFLESTDGESWDNNGICQYPTPGFSNTEDGYLNYLSQLTLPELIISEAMSSNSEHMPVNGKYYDLVELKNNTDQPLDLSGYYLSDKRSEPQRYALPDVTLEPGAYWIIYCSGEPSLGNNHTSFKLSADGETLYLSKDGQFVDVLTIPGQLQKNESYGRDGNIPVYSSRPTFGQENATGYLSGIESPSASIESGIYAEAVTVSLSGDGDIYYTLNGTTPTEASSRYEGPILIDGVTTLRCLCVNEGRTSSVASYTYAVGVEHELPVLVLSIPQASLTGDTGVLVNREKEYEHQATVTLIENGQEMFSIPCGFRLHGNDSRYCSKQNFQLRFRSDYGVGKLEYQLFEDSDIDEFNSLLLKGGSEDCYKAVMRDELATAIAADTSLYTQSMKPVVLYLGGKYWGVYYIRERFSDDYVASHLNVSEESVDMCYSTYAYEQCGNNEDFLALRQYCKNHDMSTEENFNYLASQIDVESLMDWYICRSYVGDNDLANIRRFRSSEADGLWRWMYYDLDWSFCFNGSSAFSDLIADANGDRTLMRAAIASEAGRDMFLTRCAALMNSVLNEDYISATVDTIVSQVDSEMVRDRERWNSSYEYWESCVQEIRNFAADGKRTKYFLQDLKSYFNLSDSEMDYYFSALDVS